MPTDEPTDDRMPPDDKITAAREAADALPRLPEGGPDLSPFRPLTERFLRRPDSAAADVEAAGGEVVEAVDRRAVE